MKAPAFQLYASDFLSDHCVDIMTPEELGGYFRLILVAWQQEQSGYLPYDDGMLASWSKLGKRWEKCRTAILRCFKVADDGRIYQKRMVEVAAAQEAFRKSKSEAGKAGAAKHWELHNQNIAQLKQSHSTANVLLLAKNSSLSPSPSPTNPPLNPPHGGNALVLVSAPPKPQRKKRERRIAEITPDVAAVLETLNRERIAVIPGAQALAAIPANVKLIADRLAEGYTVENCKHVIAVCADESRTNPDQGEWFNAVTPFRSEQFLRKLQVVRATASRGLDGYKVLG